MKQNSIITGRITLLRNWMKAKGLAAFIIPSTDPHAGEYTPEHWNCRQWISGFTGSAGTVVVTTDQAGLWTDSRYFLQAAEQLEGTGICLFKDRLPGTPSIPDWLGNCLPPASTVGIDGWVNTIGEAEVLRQALSGYGLRLAAVGDPFATLWTDRPPIPENPVFCMTPEYAGESCPDKLQRIRTYLTTRQTDGVLLSALDEIAWTLNLRGSDIHCNPLFVSYLLICTDCATLYINKVKLPAGTEDALHRQGITVKEYTDSAPDLLHYAAPSLLLPPSSNLALYEAAQSSGTRIDRDTSPVLLMKAIKNPTEIAGFHAAMRKDGVAMVRFLKWIKEAVKSGKETELTIDRKLYELRSAQVGFKGISFDTIAGYQAHGAIVHYEATAATASRLQPEGLLLLDSGAQYLDGTTDITRTIVLGPVSDEQKTDYTLVLKGMIALSRAVFPHGTCGTQLDVLARQFLWGEGLHYGHGTGHGVGHFLCVHEGPHQLRTNYTPALLLPGMTLTNEPGIYKEGRYGIRIENTMLIVPDRTTEFGDFYRFEPLTLCPIDLAAIVPERLTTDEKDWLNRYHQQVYETLCPLLDTEEREWLKQETRKI